MTVLRESPWYQEILKEGLEQGTELGLQRGLQQGLQQGLQRGEAALVLRQLKRRLGQLSSEQEEQVKGLSVEQLEELGEALLDFTTMTDLESHLAGLG